MSNPDRDEPRLSAIRVRLLGSVALYADDGTTMELPSKNEQRLVARLATQPQERIRRSDLVDTVYPDGEPSSAAVDTMLSRFRSTLRKVSSDDLLEEGRHGAGGERWVQLKVNPLAVDALLLLDLVSRAASCDDQSEARDLLEQATDLFLADHEPLEHPDPMTGLTSGPWETERLRYRSAMVDAELALARIERGDDGSAAEQTLRRLTRIAPTREDVWEALVKSVWDNSGPREANNLIDHGRRALLAADRPDTPLLDRLGAKLRNEDSFRSRADRRDGSPTILIIDDHDGSAMRRQLGEFDCHVVEELEAALAYIADPANPIDAALVDMNLGQPRDGELVLDAIRRHRAPEPPPVTVVSLHPVSPGAQRRAYERDERFKNDFGVYEIVRKTGPDESVTDLVEVVEDMLRLDAPRVVDRLRTEVNRLVGPLVRDLRRKRRQAERTLTSTADATEAERNESTISDLEAIEGRLIDLRAAAEADLSADDLAVEDARLVYADLVAELTDLRLIRQT